MCNAGAYRPTTWLALCPMGSGPTSFQSWITCTSMLMLGDHVAVQSQCMSVDDVCQACRCMIRFCHATWNLVVTLLMQLNVGVVLWKCAFKRPGVAFAGIWPTILSQDSFQHLGQVQTLRAAMHQHLQHPQPCHSSGTRKRTALHSFVSSLRSIGAHLIHGGRTYLLCLHNILRLWSMTWSDHCAS